VSGKKTNLLISSLLFFCISAWGASDGATAFMAGSFDMPTKGHITAMKAALHESGTDRLVVMVNTVTGPKDHFAKDFYTSFQQRKKMILLALGSDASKVTLISEPPKGYSEVLEKLRSGGTKKLRVFIGEDLYRGRLNAPEDTEYRVLLRPGQETGQTHEIQARVKFVNLDIEDGISSTKGRTLVQSGKLDELTQVVDPKVAELIKKEHLYTTPTGQELTKMKRDYQNAWQQFWEKNRTSALGGAVMETPEFNPAQSPDAWQNKFEQHFKYFADQHRTGFCINRLLGNMF